MLQLRQGASALQPDPRLRVRDGGLSPGVLLPGGGQETGGKQNIILLPSAFFFWRLSEPDDSNQLVKSCEISWRAPHEMFTAAEAVYSSDGRPCRCHKKQRDSVKWCGKFHAEQLSCTHAAVIEKEFRGDIVYFSSKCHPCRPLNVFFRIHQRVPLTANQRQQTSRPQCCPWISG